MLETILSIMSSGGIGAVVGLVGSFATKFVEYKVLARKLQYEKEMAEIRTKELQLEHEHAIALADKSIELAETEGNIAADVASFDAFKEAQKELTVKYGTWVDKLRGTIRPIITIFLLTTSTVLMYKVWIMIGGLESYDEKQLFALFDRLVDAAIFLTMTSVTWWFGTRPSEWIKNRNP